MQQVIYEAIVQALEELGVIEAAFVVERPSELIHGDYSTNVALVGYAAVQDSYKADTGVQKRNQNLVTKSRGGETYSNPRELAQSIKNKLADTVNGIEKIEIAGPGFLNFYLAHEAIEKEIQKAAHNEFAKVKSDFSGKTVMVEYTQPNPFKEFHIGHLMSNTIGESIANILEEVGTTVIRANYQGDVGPHVAKAMYVLLRDGAVEPSVQDISAAYIEGARIYEEDVEQKELIDQLNKFIYQQYEQVTDQKVWNLYQWGRRITLEHFEELYHILGTKFDFYFFESETNIEGLSLVHAHPEIFEQSQGATVFHGENHGLHTRVFINSRGIPTYETKDLGLAVLKKQKADFDLSVTITANEQDEYFKVVFTALSLVHPDWNGQFIHKSHGMMRFAEGKMSSRRGNVVTGDSLLMDLKDAAKEKMQGRNLKDVDKTAEQIAVGAIKYAVLKQGSGKDIIFDPEKSLSLEGDSGPYLQYALTRALSVLKKAETAGVEIGNYKLMYDEQFKLVIQTHRLSRLLLHVTEVVGRAASELEPHLVTTYLTELSSEFNSWYASERIIEGKYPEYMLLVVQAFTNTMKKGLHLLGIPAPEEM